MLIIGHSVADHVSRAVPDLREVYKELERSILALGSDIAITSRRHYIAFIRKSNFVDIVVYPLQLNVYINMKKGSLLDSRKIAADVADKKHWGNGHYLVIIRDTKGLQSITELIKQSYEANGRKYKV